MKHTKFMINSGCINIKLQKMFSHQISEFLISGAKIFWKLNIFHFAQLNESLYVYKCMIHVCFNPCVWDWKRFQRNYWFNPNFYVMIVGGLSCLIIMENALNYNAAMETLLNNQPQRSGDWHFNFWKDFIFLRF